MTSRLAVAAAIILLVTGLAAVRDIGASGPDRRPAPATRARLGGPGTADRPTPRHEHVELGDEPAEELALDRDDAAGAREAVEGVLDAEEGTTAVAVAVAVAGDSGEPLEFVAVDGTAPPDSFDVDDPYGVMSVTKTFSAALVLRYAASGRISLDEPMPPIAGVIAAPVGVLITPRMLLAHSSGLVSYTEALGYDPLALLTPVEAVNLALATPLSHVPGEAARYASTNYHWLGLLLEHVTERSFSDLIDDLAEEFGLNATRLDSTGRPGWVGFASGGLTSTIGDIARWGDALFTPGQVLDAELLQDYVRIGPLGVGLGLWPVCPCSDDGRGATRHAGVGQLVATGGIVYYPAERLVVVARFDQPPEAIHDVMASLGDRVRQWVSEA